MADAVHQCRRTAGSRISAPDVPVSTACRHRGPQCGGSNAAPTEAPPPRHLASGTAKHARLTIAADGRSPRAVRVRGLPRRGGGNGERRWRAPLRRHRASHPTRARPVRRSAAALQSWRYRRGQRGCAACARAERLDSAPRRAPSRRLLTAERPHRTRAGGRRAWRRPPSAPPWPLHCLSRAAMRPPRHHQRSISSPPGDFRIGAWNRAGATGRRPRSSIGRTRLTNTCATSSSVPAAGRRARSAPSDRRRNPRARP